MLVMPPQGEVHIYGSHSELSERNIDTTQLLGLIHQKEDERDEFAYKDDDSDGMHGRVDGRYGEMDDRYVGV